MKRVVYTGLFGDYDELVDPVNVKSKCDYICFTDREDLSSKIWKIRILDFDNLSPALSNRMVKILAHRFLPEYDESIYVDANIFLKADLLPVFELLTSEKKILVPRHPFRDCIYDEIYECIRVGKIKSEDQDYLVNLLRDDGYPSSRGLFENNIILRRHNDDRVKLIMERWFKFVLNVCPRDQVSLNYLAWKFGFKIEVLPWCSKKPNPFFAYRPHSNINSNFGFWTSTRHRLSARRADSLIFYWIGRSLDFLGNVKKRNARF